MISSLGFQLLDFESVLLGELRCNSLGLTRCITEECGDFVAQRLRFQVVGAQLERHFKLAKRLAQVQLLAHALRVGNVLRYEEYLLLFLEGVVLDVLGKAVRHILGTTGSPCELHAVAFDRINRIGSVRLGRGRAGGCKEQRNRQEISDVPHSRSSSRS